MNPSPKKPSRLLLVVVLIALAAGTLVVFRLTRERGQIKPVTHPTMQMQAGGVSIQFPESINTQKAADVSNWSASVTGATDPVSVQAATIGTDDRTVFLEILDLKPGMQLKVRYNLQSADGKELRGALTGTVKEYPPLLSPEKKPSDEGKDRQQQR